MKIHEKYQFFCSLYKKVQFLKKKLCQLQKTLSEPNLKYTFSFYSTLNRIAQENAFISGCSYSKRLKVDFLFAANSSPNTKVTLHNFLARNRNGCRRNDTSCTISWSDFRFASNAPKTKRVRVFANIWATSTRLAEKPFTVSWVTYRKNLANKQIMRTFVMSKLLLESDQPRPGPSNFLVQSTNHNWQSGGSIFSYCRPIVAADRQVSVVLWMNCDDWRSYGKKCMKTKPLNMVTSMVVPMYLPIDGKSQIFR